MSVSVCLFLFNLWEGKDNNNPPLMGYYKTIDGKKMDGKLIDQASLLVQGAGDGRISVKDAEILMNLVKGGNTITEVEKDTIEYIFRNFKSTSGAEEWFRKELLTWQSHKVPIPMTVPELSAQHFATVDVFSDPAARAARKHQLEAATSETNQDHDEIGLWIRLRDGMTVKVSANFIELAGEFVQLHGGCMVPVKAIEKIEI